MSVRFLFVFDLLFNLFRIALWPSVGKEFHLCCFYFSAVLIVDIPFRLWCLGQDVEFDLHCLFIYLTRPVVRYIRLTILILVHYVNKTSCSTLG